MSTRGIASMHVRLLPWLPVSRLLVAIVAMVVMLVAQGCSSEPKVYSDSDVPIVVRSGDCFVLSLPDNPDTGYRWEAEFEESAFELVSEELVFPEDRDCKLCAWGYYRFTFTVADVGESVILVALRRPLEPDDVAMQHLFNVTVTPR